MLGLIVLDAAALKSCDHVGELQAEQHRHFAGLWRQGRLRLCGCGGGDEEAEDGEEDQAWSGAEVAVFASAYQPNSSFIMASWTIPVRVYGDFAVTVPVFSARQSP